MDILKSPVFIVCCLLFVLHQLAQRVWGISWPLADAYLDSFLSMPILLTLIVAERRVLFRRGRNYRLSVLDVVVITLFVALITELLFPLLTDRFTGDWLDVVAYGVGSALFLFTTNRFGAWYG